MPLGRSVPWGVPILAGALLFVTLGLTLLVLTIRMLVQIGRGTLAPWSPTERLVVSGIYKVLHLAAERYHHGWSAEKSLRQHTDLRPEEVYAALTYFYDHHDELVAQNAASVDRFAHRVMQLWIRL